MLEDTEAADARLDAIDEVFGGAEQPELQTAEFQVCILPIATTRV